MARSLIFNQVVKHDRMQFAPGVVYGFEDPDAAPYFTALGWAEESSEEPVITVTLGEIDIDPATVHGSGPLKGQLVLGGDA